jgi:hypothetical protein
LRAAIKAVRHARELLANTALPAPYTRASIGLNLAQLTAAEGNLRWLADAVQSPKPISEPAAERAAA